MNVRTYFLLAVLSLSMVVVQGCGGDTGGGATVTVTPQIGVAASPASGTAPLEVTFRAQLLNGTEPVTYVWDFGDGSEAAEGAEVSHTFTQAGTFEVKVTGRNSAGEASASVEVEVAAPLEVSAVAAPTEGIAPLEVAFDATIEGGKAPLTIAWDLGDGSLASVEDPTYTYQNDGNFKAVLTVTDAAGNQGSAEVEINVQPDDQPFVQIVASPTEGSAPLEVAFEANVTGGDGDISFAWDFGDGATSTDEAPQHTYTEAGTYAVLLRVTDADGDEATAGTEIVVAGDLTPTLEISAEPVTGIAPLEVRFASEIVGGNEPVTIAWDFGNGETSILREPTQTFEAGTFTVTATATDDDGDEVVQTIEVVVDEDSVPEIAATASPETGRAPLLVSFGCAVTQETGNAPFQFAWDFGDGQTSTLQDPTHTYSTPGDFTATCRVEDADGDVVNANVVVSVVANQVPEFIIQADPTSGLAPLNVNFNANVVAGDAPFEFAWDFANQGTADTQDPSFAFTEPGNYQVSLTVTDTDGDAVTEVVEIAVGSDDQPALEISADVLSGVAPLEVGFASEIVGGNEPVTIAWDFGNGETSILREPTQTFEAGTFTITATVTDGDGDEVSDTLQIVVDEDRVPELTVSADPTEGIAPLSVSFNCAVDEGTGNAPFQFLWDFGNGQTSTLQNPSFSYSEAGTFTAACRVIDADGDQVTVEAGAISVETDLTPTIDDLSATPTSGVTPLEVAFALEVAGGNAPLSVRWDFGDGAQAQEGEGLTTVSHTYQEVGAFTARATVTDANGDEATETVIVTVGSAQAPVVEAVADPLEGEAPLAVSFDCSVTDGTGNAPFQFLWDFGDGTTSTLANPTHTYTEVGDFTAICQVTDRFDQRGQSSVTITSIDPNAAPVIAEVRVSNGVPGSEQTCGAVGQTLFNLEVVASDADNDPLEFEWRVTSSPQGSAPEFADPSASATDFQLPEQVGRYEILIRVQDGRGGETSQTVTLEGQGPSVVTIIDAEALPAAEAGAPYSQLVSAALTTACGLPFNGLALEWSAEGARVVNVGQPGPDQNETSLQLEAGCDVDADAALTASLPDSDASASVTLDVVTGQPTLVLYQLATNVALNTPDFERGSMALVIQATDSCTNPVDDAQINDLTLESFTQGVCFNQGCEEGGVPTVTDFSIEGTGVVSLFAQEPLQATVFVSSPDESLQFIGLNNDPLFDIDRVFPVASTDSAEWQAGEPLGEIGAFSGRDALATNLSGDYAPSDGVDVRSLTVELPVPCIEVGEPLIQLRYQQRTDIGPGALGIVLVNGQGAAPIAGAPFNGTLTIGQDQFVGFQGTTQGYVETAFDLSAFNCQETVTIDYVFVVTADDEPGFGWALDDITVFSAQQSATGRFLPGAPVSADVVVETPGVLSCETSPARVSVFASDLFGNPAQGLLAFDASAEVSFTPGEVGILRDLTPTSALLELGEGVAVFNVISEAAQVTLSTTSLNENDVSVDLDFGARAELENELEGACVDGIDNDCDGDLDCEDVNCATEAACGPDMLVRDFRATLRDDLLVVGYSVVNDGFQAFEGCALINVHAVPTGDPAPAFPFDGDTLANFAFTECRSWESGLSFDNEVGISVGALGLAPGDYDFYLSVVRQPVDEPDVSLDNNLSAPTPVNIPASAPDLQLRIDDAISIDNGTSLRVVFSVLNAGNVATEQPFDVSFLVTAVNGDVPLSSAAATINAPLGPGEVVSGLSVQVAELFPGQFDLYGIVDAQEAVAESDEDNNFIGPLAVTLEERQPQPDLTVSITEVVDTPGGADVSFQIANEGDSASPEGVGIVLSVFQRQDPDQPGPNDEIISFSLTLPALDPLQAAEGTLQLQGLELSGFLTLQVDATDSLPELNEDNNFSLPFDLNSVVRLPDLVVTLDVLQTNDNEATLEVVVSNIGGGPYEPNGPVTFTFAHNVNGPDIEGAQPYGSVQVELPTLNPGNEVSFQVLSPNPSPELLGFVFVVVDPDDTVPESDNQNNVSNAAPLNPDAGGRPDLTVTITNVLNDNGQLIASLLVQNLQGDAFQAGTLSFGVLYNPDNVDPVNAQEVEVVSAEVPTLAAGQEAEVEVVFADPSQGTGEGFIIVEVDANEEVQELDESNNLSAAVAVTPQGPDLTVLSVELDPEDNLVGVLFQNQGNQAFTGTTTMGFYNTQDETAPDAPTDDALDFFEIQVSLQPDDIVFLSFPDLQLPESGFLWAFIDLLQELDEINEFNNLSPPLNLLVLSLPDLIPNLLSVSEVNGEQVLQGEVINNTSVAFNGTVTAVYYVTDTETPPAPDAQPLVTQTLSLNLGAFDFAPVEVELPALPDDGFLWMELDPDKVIEEADELNNLSNPLSFGNNQPLPDLVPEIIEVVSENGQLTVRYSVINQGQELLTAQSISVQLLAGLDGVDINGAIFVTEVQLDVPNGTLEPGASLEGTLSGADPVGRGQVFVFADSNQEFEESDENNNVAAALLGGGDPLPDLAVQILDGQVIDGAYVLTLEIANGGEADFAGDRALSIGVFNTVENVLPGIFDQPTLFTVQLDAIPAGGAANLTLELEVIPQDGTFLFVQVDFNNDVLESDEQNNITPEGFPVVIDVVARAVQAVAEIVISEVMYDTQAPISEADGEWVELFNTTQEALSLDGCTLGDDDGAPTSLDGLIIEPQGFLVLVRDLDPQVNGGITGDAQLGFALTNGGDPITLDCGLGQPVSFIQYDDGGAFPDGRAASIQLDADQLINLPDDGSIVSDGANWCLGDELYFEGGVDGESHFGTPGAPNRSCNPGAVPFSAAEVQALFNRDCTGCHGGSGGVNLSDFAAEDFNTWQGNAGIALIVPGDPDNSYLLAKIEGRQGELGGFGQQMPQFGPQWSEEEMLGFRLYIESLGLFP